MASLGIIKGVTESILGVGEVAGLFLFIVLIATSSIIFFVLLIHGNKSAINHCKFPQVSVDDFTFQLFYKFSARSAVIFITNIAITNINITIPIIKFSASFFVASSFIVGMHQYFGDPIHCEIVSHVI